MEGAGCRDYPIVINIIVQNQQADKSDSNYEIYTFLWDVVLNVAIFLGPLAFCGPFKLMISCQKFIFNL